MRSIVLIPVMLVVITVAVYIQVGNHQFLNFDDDVYVTSNSHVTSGINYSNIMWAFSYDNRAGFWHPITWLSHMADAQLYGMNPRGHHITNVVIHTVSSLLLFFLLFRFTGSLWQCSFVAALFALHPLRVESVAWVAERKDVLGTLFWILTLLFYSEYVAKLRPRLYILALFSFALGLMSKPMLVTLPLVMLLFDYWPLDRYRYEKQEIGHRLILSRAAALTKEKIPFFVCSLFLGVITIYAQHTVGATQRLDDLPIVLRFENGLIAYVKYIGKTLWPSNLAIFYPFPSAIPLWQVISSLSFLLLLSAAVIRLGRRYPPLAVGWFWYLVTLLPVIGLIQVGAQSMADRFSYIPGIGLLLMAAWGFSYLTKGLQHQKGILGLFACAVIITSASLTWQQLRYWRDNVSVYQHALNVTTDNFMIYDNLGVALAEKGDLDAAIKAHREAIRIRPNLANAHYNLGVALAQKGDLDAAIQEYQMALQISPKSTKALVNFGVALSEKGDLDTAIRKYQEAIQIRYDDTKAHYNLGRAFAKRGGLDAAISEFQAALRISPGDTKAHNSLGLALAQKGDLDAAIQEYGVAIRISPDNKEGHNNLGVALVSKGNLDLAIQEFQNILRVSPNDIDAHSNLGVVLAKKGDLSAAILEFQEVLRISPNDTFARNNLELALVQKKKKDEIRY